MATRGPESGEATRRDVALMEPADTTLTGVRVRVLGPLEVEVWGELLDLGAHKQRSLLAVLALHRRRPVSVGTIVDALWGESPPASHTVTLQGYVSGLRKVLEPGRAPRGAATVLVTNSVGYALQLEDGALDADRLDTAVRAAVAAFPTSPARPWEPVRAPDPDRLAEVARELDAELAGWRGEPYAELADDPSAIAERARLHEVRISGEELREAIRMNLGDSAVAARHLEPLALAHPHRERLWLTYAAALARAGRQVDALQALRILREALREELGLDAGSAVSALETDILQQRLDPGLETGPEGPEADAEPDRISGAGAVALRVMVVDDHPVFRMGMGGLLGSLDGVEVVGMAGDSAEARELVERKVDVVLMDLDLGGESGIDLTRELVERHPGLRVLVMTMHEEDTHVVAAMRAGASGYLLKSAEADDVDRALRGVARGELILGASVAASVRAQLFGGRG